jgi:hypothetical protein
MDISKYTFYNYLVLVVDLFDIYPKYFLNLLSKPLFAVFEIGLNHSCLFLGLAVVLE